MADFADFLVRIGIDLDVAQVQGKVNEAMAIVDRLQQLAARPVAGVAGLREYGQASGAVRQQVQNLPQELSRAYGGPLPPDVARRIAGVQTGLLYRIEQLDQQVAESSGAYRSIKDSGERAARAAQRIADDQVVGANRAREASDRYVRAQETSAQRVERSQQREAAQRDAAARKEAAASARAASAQEKRADREAAAAGREATVTGGTGRRTLAARDQERADELNAALTEGTPENAARMARIQAQIAAKYDEYLIKLEERNAILGRMMEDELGLATIINAERAEAERRLRMARIRTDPEVAGVAGAANLQETRQRRAEREAAEGLVTPTDVSDEGRVKNLERNRKLEESNTLLTRILANENGELELLAGSRVLRSALNASLAGQLTSEEALQILANEQLAERRQRRGVRGQVAAGVTEADVAAEAVVAAREKAGVYRQQTATSERILSNQRGELDAAVEAKVAQDDLARTIRLEANQRFRRRSFAEIRQGGGTTGQQLQAFFAEREGRAAQPNTSYQTGLQAIASGAFTTARFAVTGAGLYGVINTVQQMVRDAEELEVAMTHVRAEFTALGDTNFDAVRRGILGISADTGVAAKDVADLVLQLRGAYQLDAQTGRDRPAAQANRLALQNARAGAEIVRVTGLPLNEVTDSLTATSLAFDKNFSEIGDKALGLQDRFGVMARETIKFFGDMAAVAKQYGLSLDELGAIEGVAQQAAGKSGAAIAEGLNRVLPNIETNAGNIIRAYNSIGPLQANADKVLAGFSEGKYGEVFFQLIRDWGRLSDAQRNYFISLLGGSRQAQDIIPILNNYRKVIAETDRTESDAGRTHAEFETMSQSLAQRVAELRQVWTEFGDALFRAGLGDALKDIALVAGTGALALREIANAFALVNRASGSAAIRIAEAVIALKAYGALTRAFAAGEAVAVAGGVAAAGETAAAAGGGGFIRSLAPTALAARAGGFLGGVRSRYQQNVELQRAQSSLAGFGEQAALETSLYGRANIGTALGAGAQETLGGVNARLSGGLAALGIGTGTLWIAGAVVVAQKYLDTRKKVREASDNLQQQLQSSKMEDLQRVYDELGHQSIWERVKDRAAAVVFSTPTPREEVGKQITTLGAEEAAPRLRAMMRAGVFGEGDMSPKELERRLQRSGVQISKLLPENELGGFGFDWGDFLKGVDENKTETVKAAQKLVEATTLTPEQAAQVRTVLGNQNLKDLTADPDAALKTLDSIIAGYKVGDILAGDFQTQLRRQRAGLVEAMATTGNPEEADKYRQQIEQIDTELSTLVTRRSQFRLGLLQAFGANRAEDAVRDSVRQLQSGTLQPEGVIAQGLALLQGLNQERQQRINEAGDAAGAYAAALDAIVPSDEENAALEQVIQTAAQQFNLNPAVVRNIVQSQLNETNAEQVRQLRLRYLGQQRDVDIANIGTRISATGDPVAQAQGRVDQARRNVDYQRALAADREEQNRKLLPGARAAVAQAEQDVARANANANDERVGAANMGRALTAQRDAQDRLAQAKANLANLERLLATGDPDLTEAQNALTDAERAAADAQQAGVQSRYQLAANRRTRAHDPTGALEEQRRGAVQARDDAVARNLGEDAVNAAQDRIEAIDSQREDYENRVADARRARRQSETRDPVKKAQIEVEQAQAELARAGGDREARENAMRHLAEARQGLDDAMESFAEAEANLALSLIERKGDPVEIARAQLTEAQRKLDAARARGESKDVLDNLQADVNRSQTAVSDAQLQETLELIQFDLDMNNITRQAAIERLKLAYQMATKASDQRAIMRQIYQLEHQAAQDLQFDIPSDLTLPTLYEVRRTRGSLEGGMGYQDNRQVTVYMTNNNATDYQGSIDRIGDDLNAPPRYATGGRVY